ncbi:MAG: hypothetical protein EOM25_00610 [Deltaproteobacteria bacterium]|nr:hypothetical protein [Deltaproteobacteria bacterium]
MTDPKSSQEALPHKEMEALEGRSSKELQGRVQESLEAPESRPALEKATKSQVDDEWWCPNEECRVIDPGEI